jgi:GLPGLI family protein
MRRQLLWVLAISIPLLMTGQNITGIATYKTQRKVDIQLDSTQFNDEMRTQMLAMIQKQFQKAYTLEFNRDESVYKQVESLEKPTGMTAGEGVQVMAVGMGNADVLYRNRAEQRFVNQNEVFGKLFLIKDSIPNVDWKLEKESKNIGEYTCFKATYQTTRTVRSSVASSDNHETDAKESVVEEETTVTAWYTPQIPVQHGPGEYGGLPGLILEISDGKLSILCSRVVINPADGVNLEEPRKGKEVGQQEFDRILEEKVSEMNERYSPGGRRGEGNSFEIRIGG